MYYFTSRLKKLGIQSVVVREALAEAELKGNPDTMLEVLCLTLTAARMQLINNGMSHDQLKLALNEIINTPQIKQYLLRIRQIKSEGR
jgi:hypothetical protein